MLFRLFGRFPFLCLVLVVVSLSLVFSGCNDYKLTALNWNTKKHSDVSDVFVWDSTEDNYLSKLRLEYDLLEITKDDKTDLDKINTLCDFINFHWNHTESDLLVSNDPIYILQHSETNERKLTNLEEAYVLTGYLNSINITARVVSILPEDIEKRIKNKVHFIVEAYPKEIGKWIMIDPILKSVPLYNNKPINAVQLQRALATDPKGLKIKTRFGRHVFDYKKYISEYLYYFTVPVDNRHEGTDALNRNSKSLLLYPLGSKRPHYFQEKSGNDILYTTSIHVFYNPPAKNNINNGNAIKVVMDSLIWDNNFTSSEHNFRWNSPECPYLAKLRKEYSIDSLVIGCITPLDSVLGVMHWVHGQWEHYSGNLPMMNDPLAILQKVESGMRFSCLEYSAVLSGCLNSLGFKSRVIDLYPVDVETKTNSPVHVGVEIYIPQYSKWIFADPQWDVVPMTYDIPLNAVEFQDALWESHTGLRLASHSDVQLENYTAFIAEYLYYFAVHTDNRHAGFMYPDRSNQKIILVTANANNPLTVQGYILKKVQYTNKLTDFYINPRKINF